MSAGTILLIALAVLMIVIMYRVAGGAHGAADAAPVAGRGADAGGESPVVGGTAAADRASDDVVRRMVA